MGLDLYMAVGLNTFFAFFPFIFFFYFQWVGLLMLEKKKSRKMNLKKMFMVLFSNKVKSSVSFRIFYSNFIISIMFVFLLYGKFWNLIPYTKSVTSKIIFTLTFSFLWWLLLNISSLLKDFMVYFSHFTTLGSPLFLVSFIKVMEMMSNFIRPMTLGVRLAVNLLTGHLLLSMYSSFHLHQMLNYMGVFYVFLMVFGLIMFFYEFCVSMIQALVYALMISQYFDEHS